jgi:hypothetical protein
MLSPEKPISSSEEHGINHGSGEHGEFDPAATAFHHISDQNIYSIGPFNVPLPCMLYAPGKGSFLESWDIFSSSKFDFESMGHGDGRKAYNQYVLHEGQIMKVQDPAFPVGEVELTGFSHKEENDANGKPIDVYYATSSRERI